ncbi:uncharacterized protein CEXT_44261 [Caerostris extrusa]|uniref:25S rRNA (uridine-N(3))-methyltransferase BMT5-like domain-containing protein n=1 Tax=Caerostris extrusa TaxID=172846 RepID=A0AAV4P8D0_CAEEX|nr:uncharacterized protein CEXT_44261 [Caerostris extrusa]
MNIKENRKLVELFFKSAQRVLQVNGKIGVTLCCKQGGTGAEMMPRIYENTWKIVYLAANAHLILCDIEFFNSQLYDTYKCSGYRGLSKQFNIEGAVTHMFCRSELAPVISENHDSFKRDITEKFILDIKNLYLSLSKKVNTPFTKLAYSLDAVVKSACPSLETIFIADLLLCKSFALPITSVTDKKIINCDETYFT